MTEIQDFFIEWRMLVGCAISWARLVGELILDNEEDIWHGLSDFCADLFTEEEAGNIDWMTWNFMLSHEDVTLLERAFSKEEVVVPFQLLNGDITDKTPGLDGMTLAFFGQCWEHFTVEVVGMFLCDACGV